MKEKICRTLKERGYSEHSAKLLLPDLMRLSAPLDRMLQAWLNNEREQLDYSCNGFSIHGLQRERGMKYPAALLTMDWLMKEPEKAVRSLTKGIK